MPLLPDIKQHTPDKADPRRCAVCAGHGPTRPTGWSGRPMTDQEREGISLGRLNFFDGRFVDFSSLAGRKPHWWDWLILKR